LSVLFLLPYSSLICFLRATHVPVGEDQVQHMVLARNIAERFNKIFQQEYFPLPEALDGR
jgi:tryptophanyl-tRNA synthetase